MSVTLSPLPLAEGISVAVGAICLQKVFAILLQIILEILKVASIIELQLSRSLFTGKETAPFRKDVFL